MKIFHLLTLGMKVYVTDFKQEAHWTGQSVCESGIEKVMVCGNDVFCSNRENFSHVLQMQIHNFHKTHNLSMSILRFLTLDRHTRFVTIVTVIKWTQTLPNWRQNLPQVQQETFCSGYRTLVRNLISPEILH